MLETAMKLIREAVHVLLIMKYVSSEEFVYTALCFCSDDLWDVMSALHCATEYTKSE
jgi:hypothetical protein